MGSKRGQHRQGLVVTVSAVAAFIFGETALAGWPALAGADEPVQAIVATADVYASFEVSRAIYISAPSFVPGSDLVRRLEAAADHGTTVSVGIDIAATGPVRIATDTAAADLALHGVDIQSASSTNAWIAFVDDATFITFSPWPQSVGPTVGPTVGPSAGVSAVSDIDAPIAVRDNDTYGDRRILKNVLEGRRFDSSPTLQVGKADALSVEASTLRRRTAGEVDVATDNISIGSLIATALVTRAQDGDIVRLTVGRASYRASATERRAIAALRTQHIDVRLTDRPDRLAIEGYHTWLGSADAASASPARRSPAGDPLDFSIASDDRTVATRLHARFVGIWDRAKRL